MLNNLLTFNLIAQQLSELLAVQVDFKLLDMFATGTKSSTVSYSPAGRFAFHFNPNDKAFGITTSVLIDNQKRAWFLHKTADGVRIERNELNFSDDVVAAFGRITLKHKLALRGYDPEDGTGMTWTLIN